MSEPTSEDVAVRRFRTRVAGILALTGSALTILGSLLQQRADIPRGNPLGLLEHIDGRPWFVAAFAGVLGILCWAVAFTTIGRTLRSPRSATVARMAEPVLVVAVTLFAVTYAHDGFGSGVIAREWSAGERGTASALVDSRVVEGLVGGTSVLSQTLLGLALFLYATAMLCSRQYSKVLSWVGVLGTFGWFVGSSALFLQLPGISFELLLPFVGLATIWVLGSGISLLRRRP